MKQSLFHRIDRASRLLQQGSLSRARYLLESMQPDPADMHHVQILAARLAIARLELFDALEMLVKARVTAAVDGGISYYMGFCYDLLGNREEAVNQMYRSLTAGTPLPLLARALEYLVRFDLFPEFEKIELIEQHFENYLHNEAHTPQDAILRATVLRIQTEYDEAAYVLDSWLAKEPEDFTMLHERGLTAMRQKDWEKAHECFERTHEINPHDLSFLPLLAEAQYQTSRFQSASRSLAEVLRVIPTNGSYFYNYGISELMCDQPSESLKAFREATRLAPHLARAHYNRGVSAHRIGLLDEAVSSYQECLRLIPNEFAATKNLGLALGQQRDYLGALRTLQEAEKLRPEREDIRQDQRSLAALKLIDPRESFQARISDIWNVTLIGASLVLLQLIFFFMSMAK